MGLSLRTEAYETIAKSRREAGDAAGARTTLQAAVDLLRGHLEDAKAGTLDSDTTEGMRRHHLLESLARLQVKLGDRGAALGTIRRINYSNRRAGALQRLASDLAIAGDLDGALETVDAINSPKYQAEALEIVASAYSRRDAGSRPR
jgi:hypothetical protein